MGFSLAAVTGALIAPYIGKVLDRGSPRKVMLIGIVIMAAAYLSLANVANLLQYYLVVSIGMGLGIACMGGLSWHRSVISWFDHWRGRAIAFSVLGASLAGIMMPPLVTTLVAEYGWRTTYIIFAATTALALFPVVFLYMKDHPSEVGDVRDGHNYVNANPMEMVEIVEDSREWTIGEMYRSRAFWSIGIMFGGLLMTLIEFPTQVDPSQVPEEMIFRLGLAVGVLLPLLYLIPIALVTRYKITRAVHASIRAELDQRGSA